MIDCTDGNEGLHFNESLVGLGFETMIACYDVIWAVSLIGPLLCRVEKTERENQWWTMLVIF